MSLTVAEILALPPAGRTPEQAWQVAVAHRGLAARLALRRRRPDVEADDLVQEAVIGLWEAARSYDRSRNDSFSAYARMPILGRITQAQRRRRMRSIPGGPLDGLDVAAGTEPDAGEHDRLHAAIAALPERERTVIRDYYLAGRTDAAIAADLGYGSQYVSRIRRATLARLSTLLEREAS